MTPQEFATKVKAKYPQYANIDDTTLTQKILAKHPEYQSQVRMQEPGTLAAPAPVTQLPMHDKNAIAAQAVDAQKAATSANSPLGILANAGKSAFDMFTSSEQGLGRSVGAIFGTGANAQSLNESNIANTDVALHTLRTIRANEAAGKDTTRLKEAFNKYGSKVQDTSSLPTLPSNGEIAGQVGGTALDLLSAGTYGNAAAGMKTGALAPALSKLPQPAIALRNTAPAAGLLTKTGAGRVAAGGALGYGYDVTQGLQGQRGEDRTGAKAFIPGVGTAIGAALPALTGATQSLKNLGGQGKIDRISARREDVLNKVIQGNSVLRKARDKANSQGIESAKLLAQTDLLHGAVDKSGTINTREAAHTLSDFIAPKENTIRANLVAEGRKVRVQDVEKTLTNAVNNSDLQGANLTRALNQVKEEVAGYMLKSDKDGYIPLATVHDAKVDKYATINYLNPANKKVDKLIAKTLKETVEKNTKSVDVKSLNKELQQHYSVLGLLEKLDGKVVEGGRLGKHFARILGGVAGSHFGPLGTAVGSEIAGGLKGAAMSTRLNGKTGGMFKDSAAMDAAVEKGKKTVINLPQSVDQMRQPINAMAAPQANIVMPKTVPQETYLGQGMRELKAIGKGVVDYSKNIQPGLSTKSSVPAVAEVANKLTANEYKVLKEWHTSYTNGETIPANTEMKVMGIFDKHGIEKATSNGPRTKLPKPTFTDDISRADYIEGLTSSYEDISGMGAIKGDTSTLGTAASAAVDKNRTALRDESTGQLRGSKWRITASKPSKDGNISTGNAPTERRDVSAQKTGMSGPFDGKTFYHGSDAKFDNFDFKKTGLASGEKPLHGLEGTWLTDNKTVAKGYGKNIKQANIDTSNFHVIDAKGKTLNDFRDELWDAKKLVKDEGKSGLIVKNLVDNADYSKSDAGTHVFVVDKNTIKPSSPSVPKELEATIQKAKTASDFARDYEGGALVDTQHLNDWITRGPGAQTTVSKLLTPFGKQQIQDLNLPDLPIHIVEDSEDVGFTANFAWDTDTGLKDAHIDITISPFDTEGDLTYTRDIESDILHELTHARQIMLGKGDRAVSIQEAGAEKSSAFRFNKALTDFYKKATGKK